MLYLLLYYFLISGLCLWTGAVFYGFFGKEASGGKSLIRCLITGLITLTAAGQWIALAFPTTVLSLLLLLLLLGLLSLLRRRTVADLFRDGLTGLKKKSRFFYLCLSCFLVMIIVLNAGPSMMDDTESYHIQMVKWIQEYGSVPGIANLHLRFGFNSSWFVSIGLLSYPLPGLNTYLSLNGLLSFWFCYYLLDKLFMLLQSGHATRSYNQAVGCLIILVFCLINWPMIRGCATNSNYDFITTCCTVILFLDLFEDASLPGIEWLLWPLYLFTVRIINFPILLLPLFYFFSGVGRHTIKQSAFCISAAVLLILPFIIRNIILSGYAFFPAYQLDFFSPDWKVDKKMVVEISEFIKYYNRVNAGFLPVNETRELTFPLWIGSWFFHLLRYDRLLVVLSLFGYGFVFTQKRKIFSLAQKYFTGVMLIQLVCWFFIAPDPRFVQGCLLFGIFLAIREAPVLYRRWHRPLKMSSGLIAFLVLLYGLSKPMANSQYRNFLIPHRLPVPAVQTLVLGSIQLHIPSRVLNNWNPRCYDVALPCLYQLDPRVEARGKGIADGFRLRAGTADLPAEGEYKR